MWDRAYGNKLCVLFFVFFRKNDLKWRDVPFVIIGVLFAIFKEKAAKFVSGFNSFSKEEQAMYDKAQISRDIRNQCFIWTVIMLAGAILSCFLTPYMAIPTYIIWLVLFFREVHFDNHKAFKKYLLK